jgi:hypothetical protein
MSEIINIWNDFKIKVLCNNSILLNRGILNHEKIENMEFIDKYIPNELLEILCDSNGQKTNTLPIFLEFINSIIGLNFFHYKFLSLSEIIDTYNFMQSYSNGKIEYTQIPFAKLIPPKDSCNILGITTFTIHLKNKSIYKTLCFINDFAYKPISEFRSEIFTNNMSDFLENQIIWNNL